MNQTCARFQIDDAAEATISSKTQDSSDIPGKVTTPKSVIHSATVKYGESRFQPMEDNQPKPTQHFNGTTPYDFTAIDSWIDDLCVENNRNPMAETHDEMTHIKLLVSTQNLPDISLHSFDGSPLNWIDFIVQFKDVIHKRPCLSGTQRMIYLLQSLKGQAKQSIQGFSHDWTGYVLALKRLKVMFAQRSYIVHAYLDSLLHDKRIDDSDSNSLIDFYYSLHDSIIALLRLDLKSELLASNLLRQVSQRLPSRLQRKWAERSYQIRFQEEPSIFHLESWLKDRIMVIKENQLLFPTQEYVQEPDTSNGSTKSSSGNCELCRNTHKLNKCHFYLNKAPKARLSVVNSNSLCTNCLGKGHVVNDCPSKVYCMVEECSQRHHTTLHDALEADNSS